MHETINIGTIHWNILVYSGLLLLVSQAMGRLANFLRAPRIIGYLLAGIIFGPSCISLFSEHVVGKQLTLLTEISLVIISFSIGGALTVDKIKEVKNSIFWITVLQALGAFAVVGALMAFLLPLLLPSYNELDYWRVYFPCALILGAIAVPTAPAAILSLVHELKAKGKFTTIVLSVVALDDALAIIIYGFVIVWAKSLIMGENVSWSASLIAPLVTIFISIGIGLSVALLIKMVIRFFSPRDVMLGIILGAILLTGGLARSLGVSPLLASMVLGFVIMNYVRHERAVEAHDVIENIEEPIFGIFFLLAGAQLDISLGMKALVITLILIFGRFAGKLVGSFLGASVAESTPSVKKYLGFALLPSAGVTIGLVLDAHPVLSQISPGLGELLVSAVVGTTLINELITPFFVRYAFVSAKDIQVDEGLKFAQPVALVGRKGNLVSHRNHTKK
ncbi:MAG: cation:proton antiporter [Halobacteriovoraceae bacterium]|jgi:Kef-type K+ transport system membrane component KefB|nr:cation:proton antiporter [Halobacteriovoraceae bacterium]